VAIAKKNAPAKKATIKKSDGGSNLDDMKYTQKWHDQKIAQYSKQLAQAKVDSPYLVKGIQQDIDWLKNSRKNSVKVAPMGPRGGSGAVRSGVQNISMGSGGLRKQGK